MVPLGLRSAENFYLCLNVFNGCLGGTAAESHAKLKSGAIQLVWYINMFLCVTKGKKAEQRNIQTNKTCQLSHIYNGATDDMICAAQYASF